MLKLLRKKGVMKKLIWAVAIVIILSFGLFGTAYLLTDNNQQGYAGKIFGKKIAFDDYRKSFKSTEIQAIMRYGDNFKNIKQFLNLESEAWDRLILMREVKKQKIKISNEELIKSIEQYAFFQRDDKFDTLLYNDILKFVFRIKPREFEESLRDSLKINKLFEQVSSGETVADEDIFENYKKQNEKIQISYVFVDPTQFQNEVTVTEEQKTKYYADNKLEFLTPPAVNVDYVSFYFPEPEPSLLQDTETTETSDGEKSEESSEKTEETEKAEAEAKAKADKIEEEKDTVRSTAYTIYQELLLNPDLHEISAKNNLKMQSSGFFSMEQPNLSLGWSYDLLKTLFDMDTNAIAEPYESDNGLHIVKLTEKKEAYVPEFEEIKEDVRQAVANKEAETLAGTKAETYLTAIQEEVNKTKLKDFPGAAKTLGLEIHQTPEFNRGQYLPKIGISKEFQDAAFTLNEEAPISEVVKTANGYCILHRDAYVPVDNDAYAKEKDALSEKLLTEQKNKAFSQFLSTLRIAAKLENNLVKE